MRRPDKRSVARYLAALVKYKGNPPLATWRRYSLRTRVAAIFKYSNGGRDIPLDDLAETDAARRRPRDGDL